MAGSPYKTVEVRNEWAVAREYRLRLKKAFDQSDIAVGLPRHLILVNDTPFKSSELPSSDLK